MDPKQKGYLTRLVDSQIEEYLGSFGAVSIEGPRWCGKTSSAKNQCNSEFPLTPNNLALARIDVAVALKGSVPRLLDEWQDYPELWDEVRFEVDRSREKGCFVLCSSFAADRTKIRHSGAGRIGSLRMSTMSLFESGDSDGAVLLSELFDSPNVLTDQAPVSLEHLIKLSLRGGWPELIGGSDNPKTAVNEYINKLCEEDSNKIDGRSRNPGKFRMLLKSLARNESTVVSDAALRRDILENDNVNLADTTMDDYKAVLERLHILWHQPAFSTNIRTSAKIGKTSKKHLADPSLVMSLMGMTAEGALNDINTYGFVFESMCQHDLKVYSDFNGFELFHYRDDSGSEIDAVVERPDGSWGAIEIKLGFNQVDGAAGKLIRVCSKFEKQPKFLCILCGTASVAYRRKDGVYVVPITRLGP